MIPAAFAYARPDTVEEANVERTVGAQGEVVILVRAREAARAARLLVRLVSERPRP